MTTTQRYAVKVTRWAQETANGEHGPYLTGRNYIESVQITFCDGREALRRELGACGVRPRTGLNDERGSNRQDSRYLVEWMPAAELVDDDEIAAAHDEALRLVDADGDYCPLPEVGADGRQLPLYPSAADALADAAEAALRARGVDTPAAVAQVRASAAAVAAAVATEASRGPIIDAGIPDLMSVTEVAERYACSRTAVQKAIDAGKLPARQVGRTWVIRREVVERGGESIEIETVPRDSDTPMGHVI